MTQEEQKQISDAHTLLQTQGVEMRKLEQQLATARKLIDRLNSEIKEPALRCENEYVAMLKDEADQFLKETQK